MLLVCGGAADPNIRCLLEAAARKRVPTLPLVFGSTSAISLHWDVNRDRLLLNRRASRVRAAFVRYDVFTPTRAGGPDSDQRSHAWYAAVEGWLSCRRSVARLNQRAASTIWKPQQLHAAIRCGLTVPKTVVSNDTREIRSWIGRNAAIAKPVGGGEYTQRLDTVLAGTEIRNKRAAAPAIVQEELIAPDVRVFGVGASQIAFQIESSMLDYREDQACRIALEPRPPRRLLNALARLARTLKLDFYAADFKTCARTGELLFLEINNAPMFAAFDAVADGALCSAILRTLTPRTLRSRTS